MNHVLIQYKPFFYRQSIKRLIHQMAVHKGDLRGSDKVRIPNVLNKEYNFLLISNLPYLFLIPKGSYLVVNVVSTCNNNKIRLVKD